MPTRPTEVEDNTYKNIVRMLCVAGVIIFGVSGWFWWHSVYMDPYRVFWGSINSSLASDSVTRHTVRGDTTGSLDQYSHFQVGSQPANQELTTLTQKNGTDTSKVVTQGLGLPREEYMQYTQIETTLKHPDNTPLNFKQAENVWGKSEVNGNQGGTLFNQGLLGLLPVAHLSPDQRAATLKMMQDKKVYTTDFNTVSRSHSAGKLVYKYDVSVDPARYIDVLQYLSKTVGAGTVVDLDASQYEGADKLKVSFTIDPLSRQIIEVTYPGSATTETYRGYGALRPVSKPQQSIPLPELQSRIQNLQ